MPKSKSHWIKEYFITGLFAMLPLLITYWVLVTLWSILKSIAGPATTWLLEHFMSPDSMVTLKAWGVPDVLGILIMGIIILGVGVAMHVILGRALFRLLEALLRRIPFVRSIYDGVRQVVSFFSGSGNTALRQVVLVKSGSGKDYKLGFLTNKIELEKGGWFESGGTHAVVYLPTNQLYLGGIIVVKMSEVIPLNIPVEEGIKMIATVGLVSPKEMKRLKGAGIQK